MNGPGEHQPTQFCPHRWCPALHALVLVAMLPALLLAGFFGGGPMWLLLALLGVVNVAMMRLIRNTDVYGILLPEEDGAPLAARPGWSVVAVLSDVAYLLAVVGFIVSAAYDHSNAAVPAPTVAGYALVAAFLALCGLQQVAHHKATRCATTPDTGEEADAASAGHPLTGEPDDHR
ncbi:hypothetical protein [Streptomyces luteireticuli]|uniref:hypothetical protein n=1 Tax=Streptomyces luteireticuli TaxID=173858 RepID=UPI00355605FC